MTRYSDSMDEKHDDWCHYPSEKCTCPQNHSKEHEFTVNLLVSIRAFGLTEDHKSNIIAKVNREMHLNFGANVDQVAELYESKPLVTSHRVWVQASEVDPTTVHGVAEEEEVPEVQGNGSTGTGA